MQSGEVKFTIKVSIPFFSANQYNIIKSKQIIGDFSYFV